MRTNMSVVEREILLTVVEELLPKSNTELLVVEKRLWEGSNILDRARECFHRLLS